MTDRRQERHVLVAVGVRIASAQVDAVGIGEGDHRVRLALPPQRRARGPPGQGAVGGDLHRRAQHVLNPGGPRRRLDLEPGSRRREHHGVPHPLVRPDQLPCLGEQAPGDLLGEQSLAELGELVLRPARPGGETERDEGLEVRFAGHPAQAEHERLRGLDRSYVQVAQPVPVEVARGVAVDDGAVEVEERADRGPGRTGQDVGHSLRYQHR